MSLRVALVMPGVGILERGAEVFVVQLCQALIAEHGFDVTLYCRGCAPVPHRPVNVIARDNPWTQRIYSSHRLVRKALDTLFLDPLNLELYTAAWSAIRQIRRAPPDVVIMEGGLVGANLCRLLRRVYGTPFIDIAHGNSTRWEGALARQNPDRVVVFTEAAAAMIREQAPCARISVIPHGIDLSRFHPRVKPVPIDLPRPVVLCAGAVETGKRMDRTVEAMRRFGRGSLVILGDGPQAAAIDQVAVQALGPTRYLRQCVPQHEMPAWHCAADLFTLASHTEAFGLVYLEALACGRACVAPDEAVRREVLGDAALFYPPDDLDAYALALKQALDKDWMGAPRARAERFSSVATTNAYAQLLREVAAERLSRA